MENENDVMIPDNLRETAAFFKKYTQAAHVHKAGVDEGKPYVVLRFDSSVLPQAERRAWDVLSAILPGADGVAVYVQPSEFGRHTLCCVLGVDDGLLRSSLARLCTKIVRRRREDAEAWETSFYDSGVLLRIATDYAGRAYEYDETVSPDLRGVVAFFSEIPGCIVVEFGHEDGGDPYVIVEDRDTDAAYDRVKIAVTRYGGLTSNVRIQSRRCMETFVSRHKIIGLTSAQIEKIREIEARGKGGE